MALWRYVGWVIGCDPELTPGSVFEARQLAELIQATQGPPDEDSRSLTAAALDARLAVARTAREQRQGEATREIGGALVHGLLGEPMAQSLGVPRSILTGLLPFIRSVNAAAEPLRKRIPAAHRAAVESGYRYWNRVVEVGLADAAAEFRPPDRLAHAAAAHSRAGSEHVS